MKQLLFALALVFSVGTISAQTKIAHISSDKIMDTMPSKKKALKDLEDIQKTSIAELQEMNAQLEKEFATFQKDEPTLSAAVATYRKEQLMKSEQRMQQRQQELEQQMQQLNQAMFQPIEARLRKAVDNVATRNKIGYVVEESTSWFSKGGQDITNEVITEVLKLEAEGK